MDKEKPKSVLEERKLKREQAKKKLRFLIFAGIAFGLLFIIVIIAAIREGGFGNLIRGDGNILQNTIKNVGTSYIGTDDDPEEELEEIHSVDLPEIPDDPKEYTKNQLQNTIVFTDDVNKYSITIKKDTYILFSNRSAKFLSIQITNGLKFTLKDQEETNLKFTKVGTFTLRDTLDSTPGKITGTIEVIE